MEITVFPRMGWKSITGPTHTAAITNIEAPGSFSQTQTLRATIPKLISQMLQRERKADLRKENC